MTNRLFPQLRASAAALRLSSSLCVFAALGAYSAAGTTLVGCSQKDPPSEGETDPPSAGDDTSSDSTDPIPSDTASDGSDDAPTTPGSDPDPTDTEGPGSSEPGSSEPGSDEPSSSDEPGTDEPTTTDTEPTDTTDPGEPEIPADEMAEYFPMVDGATWTYRHTKVGDDPWNEIITMAAGTGADEGSFILTDSPDRQNDITVQWWKPVGTAIMRIKREETRNGALRSRTTYDPGFTRFDTLWSKVGFTQVITYTHVDTTDVGTTTTMREQHFKVLEIDATVTIDDTTYEDCIMLERKRPDTMDVGHYWFAKGIGKIKEIDPDSLTTEELTDYMIP